MNPDLESLSALDMAGGLQVSPWISAAMLVLSLLVGAALLMLVVRWSEGFTMKFFAALKITAFTLIAATILQLAVFGALLMTSLTAMSAYWFALLIVLVSSCVAFVFIYAYAIKQPNGQIIGLSRAIKVTMIQLGVSVALLFALAFFVAILVVSGTIDIQLPAAP